jgi:hypothetical protein
MNRRTAIVPAALILLSIACNLQIAARDTAVPPSPTESPTPGPTATETRPFPYTIREQTTYEGEKTYTCDAGGCWRDDGAAAGPPENFYPNIREDNEEIRALLSSIGLPADAAADDAERWRRIRELWSWMARKTVVIGTPEAEEPWAYLQELAPDSWPSIGEMSKVFARYGVLPLGACNSKAFTMAALLYRVGVLPDWVTVVHSKAHDGTQHLYLALHLEGRWRYLDPTCISEHNALAAQPETVGCIGADYRHPYEVIPLPGSQLTKPMLLE